jgi:hypothetical protein
MILKSLLTQHSKQGLVYFYGLNNVIHKVYIKRPCLVIKKEGKKVVMYVGRYVQQLFFHSSSRSNEIGEMAGVFQNGS